MGSAVYNTVESALVPFPQDYTGVVQLLETSGFSPFKYSNSPVESALSEVFDTFIKSTGSNHTVSDLNKEFLEANPQVRNSLNIYNTIQNAFSPVERGSKSTLENFLKTKIEDFISQNDIDSSGGIERGEAGYGDDKFLQLDADHDDVVDAEEIEEGFYDGFKALENILDYFRPPAGTFIDLTA